MSCGGYLLVGGRSSRMGVDKALLEVQGTTIAALLARRLSSVVDTTFLIGDPDRYSSAGWPVIPDLRPGDGPLAGIETALRHSCHSWNLVLGCDMPGIPDSLLKDLVMRAERSKAQVVVPEPIPGGLEPLCAVYHVNSLPAVTAALDAGQRRVKDLLQHLPLEPVADWPRHCFQNLNTPADWDRYQAVLTRA